MLFRSMRAKVHAIEQGQVSINVEFRVKPSRTKLLMAACLEALNKAENIASKLIADHKFIFMEAGQVARQLIASAAALGLLFPREPQDSSTVYLGQIRRALQLNPEPNKLLIHLDGLVGVNDALTLLDRALSYVLFSPSI